MLELDKRISMTSTRKLKNFEHNYVFNHADIYRKIDTCIQGKMPWKTILMF